MSFLYMILDWIAKIIEDKNALSKKCEDILFVITDKTDILDFLWIHVWEQVIINFLAFYFYFLFFIQGHCCNKISEYFLLLFINFLLSTTSNLKPFFNLFVYFCLGRLFIIFYLSEKFF